MRHGVEVRARAHAADQARPQRRERLSWWARLFVSPELLPLSLVVPPSFPPCPCSVYEMATSRLHVDPAYIAKAEEDGKFAIAFARIESHYFVVSDCA